MRLTVNKYNCNLCKLRYKNHPIPLLDALPRLLFLPQAPPRSLRSQPARTWRRGHDWSSSAMWLGFRPLALSGRRKEGAFYSTIESRSERKICIIILVLERGMFNTDIGLNTVSVLLVNLLYCNIWQLDPIILIICSIHIYSWPWWYITYSYHNYEEICKARSLKFECLQYTIRYFLYIYHYLVNWWYFYPTVMWLQMFYLILLYLLARISMK